MAETTENEVMGEKNKVPYGQWIKLAAAVGVLSVAGAAFVRYTEGLTLLDQFAASIAGIIAGGYMVLLVVRILSKDED